MAREQGSADTTPGIGGPELIGIASFEVWTAEPLAGCFEDARSVGAIGAAEAGVEMLLSEGSAVGCSSPFVVAAIWMKFCIAC